MDANERRRSQERERLLEREKKDLEVERQRGRRPLEGYTAAHTTWTDQQDDAAAAEVHREDARWSLAASQHQAEGHEIRAEQVGAPKPPPKRAGSRRHRR